MSQNTPPGMEGQLQGPSRLELFWENTKKVVYAGVAAAAVAITIHYAWQYKIRRDRSEAWTQLATKSGLEKGYGSPASNWSFLEPMIRRDPKTGVQWLTSYFMGADAALVGSLREQIEASDEAGLKALASGADARAPLALWALGHRAYAKSDFDGATAHFDDLKRRFPEHFLCKETAYPVQWRDEVPKPKEKAEDKDKSKPEPATLQPAKAGSEVGRVLEQIAAEKKFRAEHSEFFVAPEPDSPETLVFEIENAGTIKVKLYASRAPKHAARLLELARADGGWWVGQRVHQIEREGSTPSFNGVHPSHFTIGWPSTKEEDRTKWKQEDPQEANKLDWEDSGVSTFPGMLSVESAGSGKSQVERLVFNADDEARQADGTRVVVGRVVEGLDVIRRIVDSEFADDAGAQSGRGRPQESFKVKSIRVE